MKRKLILMLAFITLLGTSVYATSTNSVTTEQRVKEGASLAGESILIEPHSEVETGASIVISFDNAVIFDQDVIDGTCSDENKDGYNGLGNGYQYKVNGGNWNANDNFFEVMPNVDSLQLPYNIRRLNDHQIEVYLCNLPDKYADGSMFDVNGINNRPYYSIPIVAYADTVGRVTLSIDSNGTSISSSSGIQSNDNTKPSESTTEATTEVTSETETQTATAVTEPMNTVEIQMGSNIMKVNGKAVEIDAPPYIQLSTSSSMVPLRAVSEALYGGEDTVKWDAVSKTVTINYNNNVINFTIGSDIMKINGVSKPIANGVRAEIKDSRTFIPFRALGEALNARVSWDADNKIAKFN